jgi:hypothetical protein
LKEFTDVVADLWVDYVSTITAGQLVKKRHYLHRKPAYCSHSFALYKGPFIVGVTMFGPPAARQTQKSMWPENPDKVLELSRVWVQDGLPTNTVSWFISRCLKKLPPYILISYADTSVGHEGIIYRALNWHYAGSKKASVRTTTANGAHSRHNNDRNFGMPKALEFSGVKNRYWTVSGNKRERKRLRDACRWPQHLDWRNPIEITSPPKHKILITS